MRGAPRDTNSLGSASRAQLLPSPPTATTSSLGPREPITGRVSHCFRGGEKGTKLSSYLREGFQAARGQACPHIHCHTTLWHCNTVHPCHASTHMNGGISSPSHGCVPQHPGMSPHMHGWSSLSTQQPTPHHSHSRLCTLLLAELTPGECVPSLRDPRSLGWEAGGDGAGKERRGVSVCLSN